MPRSQANISPRQPHVTVAHQVLLSMGFPRQEYWSGLPFPSSEDLPNPRSNLCLLHWQADSLPLTHQGSPLITLTHTLYTEGLFLEEWIQALRNQFEYMEDALTDILRSNSGSQGLLECRRTVVCVHNTSDRLAQWGSSVVFFFFFFLHFCSHWLFILLLQWKWLRKGYFQYWMSKIIFIIIPY